MKEQLRRHSASCIETVDIEQDKDQPAESGITEKKNNRSTKQTLFKSFNNFLLSLKEDRERTTTSVEKIVWLLMVTTCFIYCSFLIWRSYTKWMESPTIVMLTENDKPTKYIPFPAVTVCPERKILSDVFHFHDYEIKKNNGSLTEKEQNMLEDLLLINNNDIPSTRYFSAGNETVGNIRKVSADLSQIVAICVWIGKSKSCNELFTPILTEEGVCFTFNTMGTEDLLQLKNLNSDYEYMENLNRTRNQGWSLEDGYHPSAPKKTYPMRGSGAGPRAGLQFYLSEMEEGLESNGNYRSGFKVIIHYVGDLPRASQHYIRAPIYEEVSIAVTASQELTSDGLKVFTPIRRQCYFADERSLKYFKLYTQSNCEYECLINFTYARCGCVRFSMPHSPDMAICNMGSQKCMQIAEMELTTIYIEELSGDGRGNVTFEEAIGITDACACLPACTTITYDTEVTQVELLERDFGNMYVNRNGNPQKSKLSAIAIFFQRPLFDVMKRTELYTTSDILASCGGLLGLFMGFSVINIVEILYFCILRICQRRRQADGCEPSNNQTVQQSKEKY